MSIPSPQPLVDVTVDDEVPLREANLSALQDRVGVCPATTGARSGRGGTSGSAGSIGPTRPCTSTGSPTWARRTAEG